MAKKDQIQLEDVLSPEIVKEFNRMEKAMDRNVKKMAKLASTASKLKQELGTSQLKDLNKTQQQFQKTQRESTKQQRKALTVQEKYEQKIKNLTKEEIRYKEQLRDKRKQLKRQVQIESMAEGSVEKMRAQLNQLNQEYDQASAKLRKKMLPRIKQLRKEIGRAEAATGRHQRNVGNYAKSFQNAAIAVGAAATAIVGLVRGIGRGIKTFSRFEKQIDKVAAISEATTEEINALRDSAIALGSTTTKTATQVGQLQEEFAKLGFTTDQILNATEATIRLSEVADADLGEAAKVAASTLNGFGLTAIETQRVVDVMAKSFTSSALDLTKFTNSMNKVAPVAKNMGFSIEQTTAMIGKLTDAGIRAETAGTQLRNIFLTLAKQGISLDDALGQINTATNKNATALELFGKRAAPIAQILAENADETERFAKELENAAGTAAKMSEQMQDNLEGDLKRLSSAWEGFVLTIEDGTGAIGKSFRAIIQGITNVVKAFTPLERQLQQNRKEMDKMQASMDVKQFKNYVDATGQSAQSVEDLKNAAETWLKTDQQRLDQLQEGIGWTKNRLKQLKDERGFLDKLTGAGKQQVENLEQQIEADKQQIRNYKTRIDAIKQYVQQRIQQIEKDEESNDNQEEEAELLQRTIKWQKLKTSAIQELEAGETQTRLRGLDRYSDAFQKNLTAREQFLRDFQQKVKGMDRNYLKHFATMKSEEGEIAKRELEKRKQQRRKWAQFGINQAQGLAQSIFKFQRAELQNEKQMAIEKAKARGASEEEIEKINQKFAKKRKQQAVKEALINGALAVTNALATTPFPANLVAAALIAAKTAFEVATIKAQEFWKGTDDSPEGMAWVGEKGEEGIVYPDGTTAITPGEPTLTYLPAHSQVIPNDILQRDMAMAAQNREPQQSGFDDSRIVNAIKNKKEHQWTVSENGISVISKRGNSFYKHLDRKFRT